MGASDAAELEAVLAGVGVTGIGVGAVRVREIAGVDQAVIARWDDQFASIMPHGGSAAVAGVLRALHAAGARPGPDDLTALERHPEAADEVEARMLDALGRAASPLAVDLLLDQPARWRSPEGRGPFDAADRARWARLNRLIDPPMVVAVGAPNIGKSSLLNALAGRGVALVADEPGTTRDHVGVSLDLGGLVVRYLDLPGFGPPRDELDRAAQAAARELARHADLVLLCRDAGSAFPTLDSPPAPPAPPHSSPHQERLRVGLRGDLGVAAETEVAVSVRHASGLAELVAAIRDTLAPPTDRANPRPWRFWADGGDF